MDIYSKGADVEPPKRSCTYKTVIYSQRGGRHCTYKSVAGIVENHPWWFLDRDYAS